jgi:hypothetical protein
LIKLVIFVGARFVYELAYLGLGSPRFHCIRVFFLELIAILLSVENMDIYSINNVFYCNFVMVHDGALSLLNYPSQRKDCSNTF